MSSMDCLNTLMDRESAILPSSASPAKLEAPLYLSRIPSTVFFVLLSVYSWRVPSYEFLPMANRLPLLSLLAKNRDMGYILSFL
jgi:hypothetical protein